MSIFQGILLGLLQGVAEFLPISSSGHLAVAQKLFGLEEIPLLFDVFLHLATLASVVLFFRKKIWSLLCSFGRIFTRKPLPDGTKDIDGQKYILAVILATVVTGIMGVLSSKIIGDLGIKYVCAGFIVTACLLVASAFIGRMQEKRLAAKAGENPENAITAEKAPNWWQALVIGFAQGIGTLPGISRSGSTIAGSLFCGVNRSVAGEFSFIISIPAILGAFILEVKDLGQVNQTIGAEPVIAGCAAAFASGYLALTWLMRLIRKGRLEWFAAYLIPIGVLGLIFF